MFALLFALFVCFCVLLCVCFLLAFAFCLLFVWFGVFVLGLFWGVCFGVFWCFGFGCLFGCFVLDRIFDRFVFPPSIEGQHLC